VLDNIPGIREAEKRGEVMFGTLDTYILYRISGGKTHITDVSSASATGMFDPFTLGWADWAFSIFKLPRSIMPPVSDSAAPQLTVATEDIWGARIPISCSVR
jgi:glycerol kinase